MRAHRNLFSFHSFHFVVSWPTLLISFFIYGQDHKGKERKENSGSDQTVNIVQPLAACRRCLVLRAWVISSCYATRVLILSMEWTLNQHYFLLISTTVKGILVTVVDEKKIPRSVPAKSFLFSLLMMAQSIPLQSMGQSLIRMKIIERLWRGNSLKVVLSLSCDLEQLSFLSFLTKFPAYINIFVRAGNSEKRKGKKEFQRNWHWGSRIFSLL